MSDLQDDLKAAFDSVAAKEATGNGGDGTPPAPQPFTPASEILPPVQADPRPGEAPKQQGERDAQGRFVPKQQPSEQTPPAQVDQTPPAKQAGTEAGTPPVDKGGQEGSLKLDPSKPPQGWTAAAKEKWATIPEDLRQEIIRREEASAAGVQRLRQQFEPADKVYQAVAPHQQYFQHIQKDPAEYLTEVIALEQTLTLGNPAQKMSILLDLADQYGVPLRQTLDSAMQGRLQTVLDQAHKQFNTPTPIPPEVQRELDSQRQWREQIENLAAENELKAFADDKAAHPLFESVRDKMAEIIEKGQADSYQDAYDLAVFRDPALRARAAAMTAGAQQQSGIAQRQAAASLVSLPSNTSVDPGGNIPENESIEDTIRRAWNSQTSGIR